MYVCLTLVGEPSCYVYNDFSITYGRESYSVRLGVNNVFDKQPPLLPQFTQFGNTGTNTVTEAVESSVTWRSLSLRIRSREGGSPTGARKAGLSLGE